MDNQAKKDYLVSREHFTVDDLNMIVGILRAPGGCPWDIEQTHKSIRQGFIEETYEVIESIDNDDPRLMCEELGDVMLQVVFHADIERESGRFTFGDVIDGICRKLIHRHPHVFGEVKADTVDAVLTNWDKIKNDEKSRRTVAQRLESIPPALPALIRAEKVGRKAACFDFPDAESAMVKLREEVDEVGEAMRGGSHEAIEEELGDLLLTVTTVARKLNVESEEALTHATDKFIRRFSRVEAEVIAQGRDINDINMQELDEIWEKIKHN